MNHSNRLLISAGFFILSSFAAFAGGEIQGEKTYKSEPEPAMDSYTNLRRYYSSRIQTVEDVCEETRVVLERARTKYDRLTVAVAPVQDRYGDPMYVKYGPLPYVGSPSYNGPAYAASFDPYDNIVVPDTQHRGYYRQRYSHPTVHARTDATLGVGASHSFMQHGMWRHPGSMAPSSARVMLNNH